MSHPFRGPAAHFDAKVATRADIERRMRELGLAPLQRSLIDQPRQPTRPDPQTARLEAQGIRCRADAYHQDQPFDDLDER